MHIEGGYIYFDSLVQPSRDVVGEYAPIKAKVPAAPSFSQKNAPGDVSEMADFYRVAGMAKKIAGMFSSLK